MRSVQPHEVDEDVAGVPGGMKHYTNPQGLFPFQATLAAWAILRENNLAVVDTGLGKTHLALATGCALIEDGTVDHLVFVVEKNKIDEWAEDFALFTNLDVNVFYGPKRQMRSAQVTLTTYSTLRDSMVDANPADNRMLTMTEVGNWFRGKRLFIAFDEAALFGGSRTSKTYRAFEMCMNSWREIHPIRTLGLTATPLERSPENIYNIVRLQAPDLVPSYKAWCDQFVVALNRFQQPWKFRDLEDFEAMLHPIILRKRKTEPDVIAQFPTTVEKFVGVTIGKAHMDAYVSLDEYIDELHPSKQMPAFRALNAFVCHPRSILASNWEEAQAWVDRYGRKKIEKLKSVKAERLIHDVRSICDAGDGGVVIFCYSVTALRCLAEDIGDDFAFVEYHGGQGDAANRRAKEAFKAGEVQVMLASSKAERGINLPEAHHIRMFDVPTRHSEYTQRLNRGSRIGSNVGGTLDVKTYVTNGTIEKASVGLWQKRNAWSDMMIDPDAEGDEGFTSAYERMMAIRQAAREESERAA